MWVTTIGDRDQTTSLRSLDKTDFFTKEVDALVLSGQVRLGIHSAKDLPDPLPQGLYLAALTRGVDPSDALVFRQGEALHSLRKGARVGTSSVRREQMISTLRSDLVCVDIRGTIGHRLHLLENGTVDALIVAEAALIRLGLTSLSRLILPVSGAPLQGQLAVICSIEDKEMRELFSNIDTRL
jgi:hydroxymethylbilane synthase